MASSRESRVQSQHQFNFGFPPVAIKVGPDQPLYAHRGLLASRSSVLQHMLYAPGSSTAPDSSSFPGSHWESWSSYATAELYLHCVYYNEIPCCKSQDAVDTYAEDAAESKDDEEYSKLADLYFLASKVDDRVTVELTLHALFAKYSEMGNPLPSMDLVGEIYEKTENNSPLRRLLVDMYVWSGRSDLPPQEPEEEYNKFVYDVTRVLFAERAKPHKRSTAIPRGITVEEYMQTEKDQEAAGKKRKRA